MKAILHPLAPLATAPKVARMFGSGGETLLTTAIAAPLGFQLKSKINLQKQLTLDKGSTILGTVERKHRR